MAEGRNSQGQLKLAEHSLVLIQPSPNLVMLPQPKLYDNVVQISWTEHNQILSSSLPPDDISNFTR